MASKAISDFYRRHRQELLYGVSLALLLFVLRWLELRFLIIDHLIEIYVGAIALMFTGLGIWLAHKLTAPRAETRIVEREVYVTAGEEFILNEPERLRLGISQRELEVLQLVAEGLSNQQIAERLFVSLNTVKTHSSRIFEKLEVRNRTQAVERARRLGLIG
ncbi:helix-turn-helix transcriptional regulator [Dyadobacter endophyticus]|uniref:Helix-turn-helix transcriptional regulator n=1 Tax=Dyadobacter endophyticus TaxID=1749036 RepID=A0ABQ1YGR7_9BACT|nr:response regulator transcription factor [Dyadobacter endophyticus]GGH23748.1 helix-turn-helix transcriptional regulator [Dyadobacter endophyticus]